MVVPSGNSRYYYYYYSSYCYHYYNYNYYCSYYFDGGVSEWWMVDSRNGRDSWRYLPIVPPACHPQQFNHQHFFGEFLEFAEPYGIKI